MEAMSTALAQVTGGTKLPLVPFSEWFDKLEKLAVNATPEIMQRAPGVKLLPFYRAMATADKENRAAGEQAVDREAVGQFDIDTRKVQRASETMRDVKPLGAEDAARWVGYWHSKGIFGEGK